MPTTLEGAKQVIAQGPVASQEVIKMMGTNGGGFFNANSAHPFENPNALTNLIQMVLIFSLGAALTNFFGRMVGDQRQGWAIFAVMGLLFLAGVDDGLLGRSRRPIPPMPACISTRRRATLQAGGNMEGKEVRFGIANSALFATVTTDASCGAINSWHDSFMPLGGMIPMLNIQLGEIIFGGVGSGLYGMLLFVIIAMFVAGLMVGRTPEYLGKKLEVEGSEDGDARHSHPAAFDPGLHGAGGGAACGPCGPQQCRPAWLSARSSTPTPPPPATTAALSRASPPTRCSTTRRSAAAMFIGRFLMIVPMLAVAGSLAAKKIVPASAGTFPTHGPLFVGLVVGVILIIGGLTYFPALALGPIVEHFAMHAGNLY